MEILSITSEYISILQKFLEHTFFYNINCILLENTFFKDIRNISILGRFILHILYITQIRPFLPKRFWNDKITLRDANMRYFEVSRLRLKNNFPKIDETIEVESWKSTIKS